MSVARHNAEGSSYLLYHFKQLLRTLASIDEVQRVSLLAHSRGTDVALSALRELILDSRAAAALFGSALRLGRLQAQDVKLDIGRNLRNVGNVDFVEHRGSADFFGHGYFHGNPAAS